MKKWAAIALLTLSQGLTTSALAETLTLKSVESKVYFTTTKKGAVAETHQIKTVNGTITNGKAEINLDLSSVDTRIQIRDERLRKLLFETNTYPRATYSANIDMPTIKALTAGESIQKTIKGSLNLHGLSQQVETQVNITKMKDGSIQVLTTQPIIINARDFNLIKGIDELRKVAGLPSISYAVPVTFTVLFKQES